MCMFREIVVIYIEKHRIDELSIFHVSPGPDNASVSQFLNFLSDHRVLHMILKRRRVILRLLQNLLHNRIVHDTLTQRERSMTGFLRTGLLETDRNFRITHGTLQRFFLTLLASLAKQCLVALHLLLRDLGGVIMLCVLVPCFLYRLDSFRVIPHRRQNVRFADIGLDFNRRCDRSG